MCFVDDGEDAMSMIEVVEDIIDSRNPYCRGGKSATNGKLYRYYLNIHILLIKNLED